MSLKTFGTYCLDFIFPKSDTVFTLEELGVGELLEKLPPAREIEGRDEHLIAVFDYKNPSVREMIWELKYKGNRNIGRKFAEILLDILRAELAERILFEKFTNPLFIPMPVSDERRRERGWNQTEIVAEEMMKLIGENSPAGEFEYSPKILIKHIHTESQARTHATKRERLENLSRSMSVRDAEKIRGRCIILFDDVTTSGSTFTEAKRALKESGARKILCVALAH
jgi:ComF family protein